MKVKKVCFMLTLLLITLGLISSPLYAATVFNLNLIADKTTYKKGDTISVKINLSNVSEPSGIGGYEGKLVYDDNVLTLNNVTASSSDNWEGSSINGRYGF